MQKTKLSHELTELVKDVSLGFLAPIFFVTAGFQVSFEVFQTDLFLLVSVIIFATFGKIIGTFLFYLPSGNGWREGVVVGAGMNDRGAVEIVIAGIGLEAGIISQEIFSILVFMAITTTATVPVLLKLGIDWLKNRNELVQSTIGKDDIVIVGAGPFARFFAKALISKRPIIMIDTNKSNCVKAIKMGLKAVNGDALDDVILKDTGIDATGMLITMTPNAEFNVLTAKRLHEEFYVPRIFAAILNERDKGLVKLLNAIGGQQLFNKIINLSEWDRRITKDQIILEQIKIANIEEMQISELFPNNSLPIIVVRNEKKLVFEGFDKLISGDLVLTLIPK